MCEKIRTFLRTYGVHLAFVAAVVLCLVWISSGLQDVKPEQEGVAMEHTASMSVPSEITNGAVEVTNNDEAVRAYLNAAHTLAAVYKFQNGGSYGGLCEGSDRLYTLEGESGGILKYIKTVGATEVFCATSDEAYLIEAKMPENGHFYCIDNLNDPIEQGATREGFMTCK